jgi:dihydrofolate synthase/folylpolyglutamate synthase
VNYRVALAWLFGLQRFGIKLGLENIRRLIAALGIDFGKARVIHVAGTNGKGSVCAMMDAICRNAGYRTGLFTSPHLVTFRERIRINGEMISEEAVASGLGGIRQLVADWDPHPTFFEITTALALKSFAAAKLGVVILETGLGGRLDATNALSSNVAVLTPIDFDHQKWLGSTIRAIANEKAGIIQSKTPVVSGAQQPAAADVIRTRADESGAPLEFVNEVYMRSPIALRGAHQKHNAALAIAALRAAKIDVDDLSIARGLAAVEWPARFQCWDERTIIDGAHNPGAAGVLAQTWRETFGDQRATLILAILADKDLPAICEALIPITEFAIFPKIRSERATEPIDLAQTFFRINPQLEFLICPSISDALEKARARPNPILLAGSLHFAGEALAHLRGDPAALEECAQ